jgi:hypothetical protein
MDLLKDAFNQRYFSHRKATSTHHLVSWRDFSTLRNDPDNARSAFIIFLKSLYYHQIRHEVNDCSTPCAMIPSIMRYATCEMIDTGKRTVIAFDRRDNTTQSQS